MVNNAYYQYNNPNYFTEQDLFKNATLNAIAEQEYFRAKISQWTAGAINTVAFPALSAITTLAADMIANISAQIDTDFLIPNLDPNLLAGFQAQKALRLKNLNSSTVGAYELLNNNYGLMAVSLMQPLSRGSVQIVSADPFTPPAIDPRYCSNPIDCDILFEALLFNNQIVLTPPMAALNISQSGAYIQNATRENLLAAVKASIQT